MKPPFSIASMSGPATVKYEDEYIAAPATSTNAAGSGSPFKLNTHVPTSCPFLSVIVYDGLTCRPLSRRWTPSWQPTHLASKIGCTWVGQPTPRMSVAATGAALTRMLRGVLPNISVAPVANVLSRPGDTLVVL